MTKLTTLSTLVATTLLLSAAARAADIFPVKGYTKPNEPIRVKFVNAKVVVNAANNELKIGGIEALKLDAAIAELGTAAGRLDTLFTPAPAAEVVAADDAPLFKIISAAGEVQKLNAVKPFYVDGVLDLAAYLPKLKDGGTYYVMWKDAPPLVVQTLYSPGRGPKDLEKIKASISQLEPAEQKAIAARYAPVITHLQLAAYAQITTDKGVIKAKFAYDVAPHTVDNFITLARQNFYDDSSFHRILAGFMIQGGDAYAHTDQAGMGGPAYGVMHEFSDKKHLRGVLSMARSAPRTGGNELDPNGSAYWDSAGSQFFIMHGDNATLDGSYSAFGEVFAGLDIVDALAKTPSERGSGAVKLADRPKIVSIKILPATAEIYGLNK